MSEKASFIENQDLVNWTMKRYYNDFDPETLQEARIALNEVLEKPKAGVALSTQVVRAIRTKVVRLFAKRTGLSSNTYLWKYRIERYMEKKLAETGEMPTIQEVAAALHFLELDNNTIPLSMAEKLMKLEEHQDKSLERMIESGEIDEYDHLIGELETDPLFMKHAPAMMKAVLTPTQERVLRETFGLNGESPKPTAVQAQDQDCSATNIRELQKKALMRLENVLSQSEFEPVLMREAEAYREKVSLEVRRELLWATLAGGKRTQEEAKAEYTAKLQKEAEKQKLERVKNRKIELTKKETLEKKKKQGRVK